MEASVVTVKGPLFMTPGKLTRRSQLGATCDSSKNATLRRVTLVPFAAPYPYLQPRPMQSTEGRV